MRLMSRFWDLAGIARRKDIRELLPAVLSVSREGMWAVLEANGEFWRGGMYVGSIKLLHFESALL